LVPKLERDEKTPRSPKEDVPKEEAAMLVSSAAWDDEDQMRQCQNYGRTVRPIIRETQGTQKKGWVGKRKGGGFAPMTKSGLGI